MPNTARILSFPSRAKVELPSRTQILAQSGNYLSLSIGDRSAEVRNECLGNADILLSVCSLLRDRTNTSPLDVAAEAADLYGWLSVHEGTVGFFDERDFFLGEAALLAGAASRLLGKRDETERWLDRAEASFRHTINPTPALARVSYIRLALRYDMKRHEEVLELLPSVSLTFEKLGMNEEFSKCRFLAAMTLKDLGRVDEAASGFEKMLSETLLSTDSALRGMALVNLGDLRSTQGLFDLALSLYRQAAPVLRAAERFSALADLKAMLAETLRRLGRLAPALEAYREAVKDCLDLGMNGRAAYLRIVLAEALLEAGHFREAEWEVLAALPTVDEEKMVPEGFAAVALLRESVRQRRTDPKALLELRNYLQTRS